VVHGFLATMASISACSLLIPSLKAGRKCSFCILSKGGAWKSVVRALKKGFSFCGSWAASGDSASMATASRMTAWINVLFFISVFLLDQVGDDFPATLYPSLSNVNFLMRGGRISVTIGRVDKKEKMGQCRSSAWAEGVISRRRSGRGATACSP
jgi:hypothetical protein